MILVSGKTKEFLFSPSDSAGDIAQTVFDSWPEGTNSRIDSLYCCTSLDWHIHALCICHIIVVEVIVNALLDENVRICGAGLFNDFLCGLHYIVLVGNMICEK